MRDVPALEWLFQGSTSTRDETEFREGHDGWIVLATWIMFHSLLMCCAGVQCHISYHPFNSFFRVPAHHWVHPVCAEKGNRGRGGLDCYQLMMGWWFKLLANVGHNLIQWCFFAVIKGMISYMNARRFLQRGYTLEWTDQTSNPSLTATMRNTKKEMLPTSIPVHVA